MAPIGSVCRSEVAAADPGNWVRCLIAHCSSSIGPLYVGIRVVSAVGMEPPHDGRSRGGLPGFRARSDRPQRSYGNGLAHVPAGTSQFEEREGANTVTDARLWRGDTECGIE